MPIGIIGAMAEEVSALIAKLDGAKTSATAGLTFHSGKLCGKDVVVVQSGIGKVNAAVCAQLLISLHGAKHVINTGVAGGLAAELNIGDIVVSSELVQHDMDVTHFGYTRGVVPGIKKDFFAADETLRRHALASGESIDAPVISGRIASGDCFVSDRKVKQDISETFGAACVEMEGAAIAHVCFLNSTPFVVIRAISDKADESATVSFNEFLDNAARNSAALVEKMVTLL